MISGVIAAPSTIDNCSVHGNGNYAPYGVQVAMKQTIRPSRPIHSTRKVAGAGAIWPGMLHLCELQLRDNSPHPGLQQLGRRHSPGLPQRCRIAHIASTPYVTITECTCYDNYATSIYVHGVHDVRLERNLIYRSKAGGGQPADVPPEDASTGITVAGSETVRVTPPTWKY